MQSEQQPVALDQINALFGTKDNFYWATWQLGWYLPAVGASCITVQYLTKVVTNQVFRIQRDELTLKTTTHKNVNKIQLYEILCTIEGVNNWGFDISHLPDKQFLLDVIHHYLPDDPLFSFRPENEENASTILFPIELFKDVNTKILGGSQVGLLFRKSEEQKERERKAKLERRVANKERRTKMLKMEIDKAEQSKLRLRAELNLNNQN